MDSKLPPSPSLSGTPNGAKRKRPQSLHTPPLKRHRPSPSPPAEISPPLNILSHAQSPVVTDTPPEEESLSQHLPEDLPYDPVAHWAETSCWPPDISQRGFDMSESSAAGQRTPVKRRNSSSSSTTTHRASQIRALQANGIVLETPVSRLKESSRQLCEDLLRSRTDTLPYPPFPPETLSTVIARVASLNEARIVRDITPWVVPAAERLRVCGESIPDEIGEEVEGEWYMCAPMGRGRPKPDYAAGLLSEAFTEAETRKLQNLSTPSRPFLFTHQLSYPFLICEAKSADTGLHGARRQASHYAAVAGRAIVELYEEAFGRGSPEARDLSGEGLVFTVFHDHQTVRVGCHYATFDNDNPLKPWSYRCYDVDVFDLSMGSGKDRDKSYAFVRNVYENFAVQHHLARIRRAVAALPDVSRAAPSLDESWQQQGDDAFRRPDRPSDVAIALQEMKAQNEQLLNQITEYEQQRQRREEHFAAERQRMDERLGQMMDLLQKRT